ncbi:MAG: glycosyltransferase family 9 protein [Thermodesulfobacteriota bacterium]|nr:glycosyltransferase family 9 protein [Thermodesulfobacteriota bacterium]
MSLLSSDLNKKSEKYFFAGNKKVQLPSAPVFLIILMGSLGDVTRGLCLVSKIKTLFPKSSITWLIEPKCKEAVTFHPLIDNILVFDRTNWKQGLKDIFHKLRKSRFDCVLDLQRHFKSGFFSFLSGAKYRIGFHPKNTKEGNWLFNNTYIPYMDEFYPKIFHYLKFTEYLERSQFQTRSQPLFNSQTQTQIQTQDLDFGFSGPGLLSLAATVLSKVNTPFIAVVLGSTWITKEWSCDSYSKLIHELLKTTPLHIVMVDTMAKYDMACSIEHNIKSSRLINLVGQTSVLELAAVLKQAETAVGPDCGSAHIASAVGTPYVTLFGPTSPERTSPYGSEHLVVNKQIPCAPCYKKECPKKEILCMNSIQVEDVKKKIFQAVGAGLTLLL